MGQRKTVRVFQLIAEDTIESKVLEIRESQRRSLLTDESQRNGRMLLLQK